VREKQTNDLLGCGLMKDCDIDPWWPPKVSHEKFQEKKKWPLVIQKSRFEVLMFKNKI
jgi:hypothetical protein